VLCRTGHSHAIYNPGRRRAVDEPERVARRRRLRQLRSRRHARRRGARRDSHVHDDSARHVAAETRRTQRGRGSAVPRPPARTRPSRGAPPEPADVLDDVVLYRSRARPSRRVDSGLPHDALGRGLLTCLGGEGTISVAGVESGTAAVRAGDAIPSPHR
jgi:hypothetical protein